MNHIMSIKNTPLRNFPTASLFFLSRRLRGSKTNCVMNFVVLRVLTWRKREIEGGGEGGPVGVSLSYTYSRGK